MNLLRLAVFEVIIFRHELSPGTGSEQVFTFILYHV